MLQRFLDGGRAAPWVFLVTDGLSERLLAATAPRAPHRFELATLSRRHDRELRDALSWLGESIHFMSARPERRPSRSA